MGAPLSSETLQTSYRVKITKRGSRGGVKTLKLASKMWIPLCFLLIHFLAKNGCFASSGGCYNPQTYGEDYRGTKSVTLSGKTCQKWAKQKPHTHEYPPKDYPELEENYCRNPYGDAEGGPWCYTTESDIRWEYCLKPCTGTGLTEVVFEGGSANATSEQKPHWLAEKAFILGHSKAWYNNKEILPSIVWYEFLIKIVPGRVSFRANNVLQAPLQWQFVGSNDETCDRFSCWTVLCEDLSGTVYPNAKWTKYCDVDEKITTEFRCLGIAVLNTRAADGNTNLRDVRMWKKS